MKEKIIDTIMLIFTFVGTIFNIYELVKFINEMKHFEFSDPVFNIMVIITLSLSLALFLYNCYRGCRITFNI